MPIAENRRVPPLMYERGGTYVKELRADTPMKLGIRPVFLFYHIVPFQSRNSISLFLTKIGKKRSNAH